jgi:hypothetical protein
LYLLVQVYLHPPEVLRKDRPQTIEGSKHHIDEEEGSVDRFWGKRGAGRDE